MTRISFGRGFPFADALNFFVVFLGVFVLGKVGLLFTTINHNVSPVWPPSGFALFALIAIGRQYWPAIVLGGFSVTVLAPTPWTAALGIGMGHALEAVLGYAVFFAVLKNRDLFSYQNKSLAIIAAGFFAPLIGASVGIGSLLYFSVIGLESAFPAWLTWYGGDLIGTLLLLPFLLEMRRSSINGQWMSRKEALVVAMAISLFGAALHFSTLTAGLLIALPLCLWTLMSAGAFAVFSLVLLMGTACTAAAWIGTGPFVLGDVNINYLYHILFLCGVSVTVITLVTFKRAKVLKENVRFLLFAWLISFLLIAGLELFSKSRDEARMASLVVNAKSLLKARMASYERALQGGVAFIQASQQVSREEWRNFATGFDLVSSLPGVFGYGYIENVRHEQAPRFLEDMRRDLSAGFKLHEVPGADLKASRFSDHFVVKYVEPESKNRLAIGLDVGTDSSRRAAAELARDSGMPAMTETIELVQDSRHRAGFALFVPVYSASRDPGSVEDRRRAHVGWTYSPFITEEFFKAALANLLVELDVDVYETTRNGRTTLVYSSRDENRKEFSALVRQHRESIVLAQHGFSLEFFPAPGFAFSRDRMTAWAGAVSMLLGLLIVGALANLQMSNRRIRRQVQLKTQELVRAQELAESHRMKSIEAARLASLGEMAGGIAHEINNPLAIIMTRTDQFKRKFEQSADITRTDIEIFLHRIDSTAQRIAKIVKGMKMLARDGGVEEFQSIMLEPLIEDALDVCREKFKSRGIAFDVVIKANGMIECQPVQICQVLVNLLNNSEHAIEGTANPWIRLVAGVESGNVRIEVVDNGHGIPSVIASRMMEPFFTTKEVGRGTGLGLSIARTIMEDHGGALEYLGDRPHTTFVMKFPVRRTI